MEKDTGKPSERVWDLLPISQDCRSVLAFMHDRYGNGEVYVPSSPYEGKEALLLSASGILEVIRDLMDKGYVKREYSPGGDTYGFAFDKTGTRRNLEELIIKRVMAGQQWFQQNAISAIRNDDIWEWKGRTKGAHITICVSESREAAHRFYVRPWYATEEAWLIEDIRDIDSLKEDFLRFDSSVEEIEKRLSIISERIGRMAEFYSAPDEDSYMDDDFSLPPIPFSSC